MYIATVILLLVILPLASIGVDHLFFHQAARPILLIGKWFVFWSAGVRLAMAGLTQFFKPQFTARGIFHIQSDDALPIVRELGIANTAIGVAGIASLAYPSFTLPIALIAAIFYGIAGIRHATDRTRGANQNLAMATDLFVGLIFTAYVIAIFAKL